MTLTTDQRNWYYHQIEKLDPSGDIVLINWELDQFTYSTLINSDESNVKDATPEECVHALVISLLQSDKYNYPIQNLYHEQYFRHGSSGSLSDEIDLLIYDDDQLPYAMFELKSHDEFGVKQEEDIEFQLFATSQIVGTLPILAYATIIPEGEDPKLTVITINKVENPTYEEWLHNDQAHSVTFPIDYRLPSYTPFIKGSEKDLRNNITQSEFRNKASLFHNEFFGEHPDNTIFINLMKCLLAKIYDERRTKDGDTYKFQVLFRNGKPENADQVFTRVNDLYLSAYQRYIDPNNEPDEINPREFSPEKVKIVTSELQGISITSGVALNSDIIGTFFEEILRVGFKQDKGMYFTHDNLVNFIIQGIKLNELVLEVWESSNHPDNRLPYIIDPACGSGTFLLTAMKQITSTIKNNEEEIVSDRDSEQFYRARMSDDMPNYWAENFIYGLDPKFVMAITAKVNMVLHGDGSAHIFKLDAFKPLNSFPDPKFRPIGDSNRSVPRSRYSYDICETFDVVISNPPFGINLAADTKSTINSSFHQKKTSTSEALFVERCFQLLKPKGRLGIVIPESLLNTTTATDFRLFLYRTFIIKAIVALPRNIFKDTPTLTSLLFARKKTSEEIELWDSKWHHYNQQAKEKLSNIKSLLRNSDELTNISPIELQNLFINTLSPIVDESSWIIKGGANPEILTINLPNELSSDIIPASNYYSRLIGYSGFSDLIKNHVFNLVTQDINYSYLTATVSEVGYKLSNRIEKARPNELIRFIGVDSTNEIPNLHLAREEVEIKVDIDDPEKVLDFMYNYIDWEA